MPFRRVRLAIIYVLMGLSVLWLWEAFTCGRCFVSTYLAPVIIVGNLAMAAWSLRESKDGVALK